MSIRLPRWRGQPSEFVDALNVLAESIEKVGNKSTVTGPNMKFVEDEYGIIIDPFLPKSGSTKNHGPWDLIIKPDPEATAPEPPMIVSVQPGLISGFLPSNWDAEWTVPSKSTDVRYACANLVTDGKAVTSVTIDLLGKVPDPQPISKWAIASKVVVIFGVYAAGSSVRTVADGNILVSPKVWLTTLNDKNPFIPFDVWYYVM